ncbi:hypothetical protein [Candidatus Poriferisocius sp.]|uniref:hypothetical protein n=1 Tax=Candidatus Poriferisocius sp. TaxID=3101276 RepID=UPI003B015E0D
MTRRTPRYGLPIPRVDNADLQRFLETLLQRMGSIAEENRALTERIVALEGNGGGATGPDTGDDA